MVTEERHQHLVMQLPLERRPIDVEVFGERRGEPPFEHVEPPCIVGAADDHVVRHEIQDVSHAAIGKHRAQMIKRSLIADVRIDRVVINDVVAVGGSRTRLEPWRAIEMRYAERAQIGHQARSIVEREAAIELQPIGGPRHAGANRPR